MINSEKIKDRMKNMGIMQKEVADVLGIKPPTVSQKINGVRPMDLDEAKALAQMLEIQPEELGLYFFAS